MLLFQSISLEIEFKCKLCGFVFVSKYQIPCYALKRFWKQTTPLFREGKKRKEIRSNFWAICNKYLVMGNLGWNSKLLMVFSFSPYAIALIEISVDLKLPYLKIEKQNSYKIWSVFCLIFEKIHQPRGYIARVL